MRRCGGPDTRLRLGGMQRPNEALQATGPAFCRSELSCLLGRLGG
jgi:hypothetical protein